MQTEMKRYSILGPARTAGQFRLRQGGTPFQLLPSFCRGRAYGRQRDIARALPEASRPPRDSLSHPLMSGYTAIILNTLYNGDGPAKSATPGP